MPWFSYRATAEPGERSPLGASPGEASLWWTWRAPESGRTVVTVDFEPSTEETNRLVVAQGDSIQTLSAVAEPAPEQVEFHATEGQTYQIGLILNNAYTTGSLSLHLPARPANNRFEERIRLPGKPNDVAEARFFGATPEAGGVDPFLTYNTVWWSWTAPQSGWVWIEPESRSSNIMVAVFSGTTVDSLNQSISQPLIGVPGTGFAAVAGETYAIAAAAVGPAPMVDRLRFSLGTLRLVSDPINPSPLSGEPIALRLEADPGNPLAGNSVLFMNGYPIATNPPGLGTWTRVETFPGRRRFEVLAADSFGRRQLSSPVDVLVRIPNDDRANAIELVDSWFGSRIGSASYRTSEATADSSDPVPTTHSVWYRWQAPEAGRLKLSVSSAPPGLRVLAFGVDSSGALDLVGSWQNPVQTNRFSVLLDVAQAQEFYLCLDNTEQHSSGRISLEFGTVAEHDAFADRRILESSGETVTNRLAYSTMEPGEPGQSKGLRNSVWYEWTAPADGIMRVELRQNSGQGEVGWTSGNFFGSVFSGGEYPALNQVTNYLSARALIAPVTGGTVYWLQIAGSHPLVLLHDFSLSVSWRPRSEHETRERRLPLTGETVLFAGTVANALPAGGNPVPGLSPGTVAVWYEWICPRSGEYILSVGADPKTARATLLNQKPGQDLSRVGSAGPRWVLPFQAEAGEAFLLAVSDSQGDGFTGRIGPEESAPNDSFPGLILPEVLPAWLSYLPRNCSWEPGEPTDATHTAWWTWRAPADGWLNVSRTDPVRWQLFQGAELTELKEISPTLLPNLEGGQDRVFPCKRGQEYHLRAGGEELDLTRQFASRISFTTLGLSLIAASDGKESLRTVQATVPDATVDGRFPDGLALSSRSSNGPMRVLAMLRPPESPVTLTQLPPGTTPVWLSGTNHLGERRLSPTLVLSVPPPHDHWAEAEVVADQAWERQVLLETATREPGEPGDLAAGVGTVWRHWVPPLSGQAVLSADAATLRVYSGDSLAILKPLTDAAASVSLPVSRGASYWVQITGTAAWATVQARVEPISMHWVTSSSPIFRSIPFPVEVSVMDPNSLVDRVEFLFNGARIASATTPPYRAEVTFHDTNQFTLQARILEKGGQVHLLNDSMVLKTVEPNDRFADASDLGLSIRGRTMFYLAGSTMEAGEPELVQPPRQSLWWTWTAPADGRLVLNASQNFRSDPLGTTVGVFTGSSLDALQRQQFGAYKADLRVTAGTHYRIQVQSNGGAGPGWQWLEWLFVPPSNNDDQSAAQELSGTRLTVEGNFGSASLEAGEPVRPDWLVGQSLWWRWTAPSAPAFGWLVPHTVTRWDLQPVAPYNLRAFYDVKGVPGPLFYSLNEPIQPLPAGTKLWFQMITPANTVGTLGYEFWWLPSGDADSFAGRRQLPPESSSQTLIFTGASLEPGEPRHTSVPNPDSARSVWLTWTAATAGNVSFFCYEDVTVEVYRGNALADLELVASGSFVPLSVEPGQTFQVAVVSPAGGKETVKLGVQHWPAPANDRFEDALLISDGIDPVVGQELQHAGRDFLEPNHGGLPAYGSVWWRWVAPRTGRVLVRTRQHTGFPLALAVYQGTTIPSLELVAERAFDSSGGTLEFEASAGTEYRLALASTSPYAAVGTRLEIVGPETVSPIRWLTIERMGEQIRLRYSAPVGRRLRLDQSTDLLKWTQRDLLAVVAEEGELTLKPEELGAGQFFRFVSPDGGE